MVLGHKSHGAGNGIWYSIFYGDWLEPGQSLLSGTVVLDPAFVASILDIVISGVAVTPSENLMFKMAGGSANETFTLDVQVVTKNPTETRNDTVEFRIVAQ